MNTIEKAALRKALTHADVDTAHQTAAVEAYLTALAKGSSNDEALYTALKVGTSNEEEWKDTFIRLAVAGKLNRPDASRNPFTTSSTAPTKVITPGKELVPLKQSGKKATTLTVAQLIRLYAGRVFLSALWAALIVVGYMVFRMVGIGFGWRFPEGNFVAAVILPLTALLGACIGWYKASVEAYQRTHPTSQSTTDPTHA